MKIDLLIYSQSGDKTLLLKLYLGIISKPFNRLMNYKNKGNGIKSFVLTVLLLLIQSTVFGQTFILKPFQKKDAANKWVSAFMLKRDKEVRAIWSNPNNSALNLTGTNSKLIIGKTSNSYNFLANNVSGENHVFIPNNVNLPPGRYYARITNSAKRSAEEIQADFAANPQTIKFTNEVLLIVEANQAPVILAPRGTITNSTPTFQWQAVSGVVSYWVIVSSTPFELKTNDKDEIAISGATVVWQIITNETSVEYGDINYDSPYVDEARPLSSGQEYSYTVLNVYEENNPVFASPVFGGVIPFTYSNPNSLPKATLISPAAEAEYFAQPTLTFKWDPVAGAANYTINLFQLIKQQGVNVTVPIWSSTTTNTIIDFDANTSMKNGRYQWNVTTNNSAGGGTMSNSRFFTYNIPTGAFTVRILNNSDNSSLIGVELYAKATNGGVTPLLPYLVQQDFYSDSLVAGTYEFQASKTGFKTLVSTGHIIKNKETTTFNLKLEALPSSIEGSVKDAKGNFVSGADVFVTNATTKVETKASTSSAGNFNVSVADGSYSIKAQKVGYINSSSQTISLTKGQQKKLTSSLIITNDAATVSGTIVNEDGGPVQLATVTIFNSNNSFEVKSNSSGFYQFNVTSGNWNIKVERTGFVKPDNLSIALTTGEILQNQNFVMVGNANQVVGFVRQRVTNADGTTGLSPFSNIEVVATPSVGSPIVAKTALNGQFNMSLKAGAYTIKAERANFTTNQTQELVIGIAVGETISGMDFELIPNPSSVSGTVILPNGNGVNEALVTMPGVGEVLTSSAGTFTLSVPEGTRVLRVTKTGHASPEEQTVSVSAGQNLTGLRFQMTQNAGSISGKILSEGQPLANANLFAVNKAAKRIRNLTSGSDGTFNFSIIAGTWYIRAEKAGFLTDSTGNLTIGPGQSLVNQTISLVENTATLRGTITDGIQALRNVKVSITTPADPEFLQTTNTQVKGSFAFIVTAGRSYQITTSLDGFGNESAITESLVPKSVTFEDFVLKANPSSVAGTVTIAGTIPVNNAYIVAIDASGNRVDSTLTKSNGTYLLGLNPGTYTLESLKRGYTKGSKQSTLQIGQNVTGIDFTMPENFAFVTGTVKDGSGNTIEQALINVTRRVLAGSSTTSDQNGVYSINKLIGGDLTFTVSKTGYQSFSEVITIKDGQFVDLNPILLSKDGSISGIVKSKNGDLISNAIIDAIGDDGNNYVTTSDDDGNYAFTKIGFTQYELTVSASGFTSDEPVEINLTAQNGNQTGVDLSNIIENNAVITGTVINDITKDPIQGVTVSATSDLGSGFSLTSSDGSYRIENLAPSEYSLVVAADGFRTDTAAVVLTPSNPEVSQDLGVIQNNGVLKGRVLNSSNTVLSFRPFVVLTSERGTSREQTDSDGNFSFESLETDLDYTLQTDIFKDGYSNTETAFYFPLGQPEFTLKNPLRVPVSIAKISGNAQEGEATVKVLRADNNDLVRLLSTRSDGSYEVNFLSAGTYKVNFRKQGFRFNPDTTEAISLTFNGTSVQNAVPTPNIGRFSIQARRGSNALSNVDVSLVSTDTTVILAQKTNSQGIAEFLDVPASRNFIIRPSIAGYTPDSTTKRRFLAPLGTASVVFTFSANNSSIKGDVKYKTDSGSSALIDASITAILTETGQTFQATSLSSGIFNLPTMPSGNYRIIASKNGYEADTLASVNLKPGEKKTLNSIVLNASVVTISGSVRLKGKGVANVKVSAISTSTYETVTSSNGSFRFLNLPVSSEANDTTVYQIQYNSGLFTKSALIRLSRTSIGTTQTMPVVNLPSGQIQLSISNGVEPLSGVQMKFGISGGTLVDFITDETGLYASLDNLRSANYLVSLFKEGFMIPDRTISIQLASDTSQLVRPIFLPYTQKGVSQILADRPTTVTVINVPEYNNSRSSGTLFYKTESQSAYSRVPLIRTTDSLYAQIPAIESEQSVSFYTVVNDTSRNNIYRSSETSIIPLASGILKTIRINPTLDQQTLRLGDSYSLRLVTRDGVNQSLADKFLGDEATGSVTWEILSGGTSNAEFLNQNGVDIQFKPEQVGAYKIKVAANLNGASYSRTINVTISEVPIKEIQVSRPSPRARNSASHLFSFSAFDTTDTKMLLGNSVNWSVEPREIGTITAAGLFTPTDLFTIGSFTAVLKDSISGIDGVSGAVDVFAVVNPEEAFLLTDNEGLILEIPANTIPAEAEISVRKIQPEKTKKFVFAKGTETSYTVSETVYSFNYSGSELQSPISLTLPVDNSLSLFNGGRQLGRFDNRDLEWEIITDEFLATAPLFKGSSNQYTAVEENPTELRSSSIMDFGQFAVLVANESLGLDHLVVLPTPFSPTIAPVKIGYFLSTAFPPATVNIKVYNMRGELIKNVLENDLQQPGLYGSATKGLKEITWDGTTNTGELVRNGRYIIEVKAKDQEKEVKKIIQVVVIK